MPGNTECILYDTNGDPLAVDDGVAIPSGTPMILSGGSDGTNARYVLVDSSGRQILVGAGTAGTPAGGVLSIQGVASGVAVPVSGTVTANAGSGNFSVVQATAALLNATVTGTVTANIGTSGALALDATLAKLTITPGTAIGSNTLAMIGGHVTTGSPTYTNGNINPLSLTTAGALRIDGSAVTQPVSGTVTANQGTSPWVSNITQFGSSNVVTGTGTSGSGIPRVTVSNDSNILATQSGTWTVQQGTPPWSINHTQINGNAVTTLVAGEQKVAVEGLVADGGAVSGNPVLVGGQDGTNVQSITTDTVGNVYTVDYGAPSNSFRGISFGRVIGSANTLQAVRATTYTQQSSNAQRSISSANASDTSAGTGARQVLITYYTATMTGPFTETVTMNGTTPVNTSNTNICFIEKMEVVSVGSNGSNVGVISLFVSTGGGGGTIGTLSTGNVVNGRGDNQTLWAHHYVATGVTMNLTSYMTGTNSNQGATTFIMSIDPTTSTSAEKMITDSVVFSPSTSSIVRNFVVPLRIAGPVRITLYVVPNGSNTPFFGGFNFWEL